MLISITDKDREEMAKADREIDREMLTEEQRERKRAYLKEYRKTHPVTKEQYDRYNAAARAKRKEMKDEIKRVSTQDPRGKQNHQ